MSKFVVFLSILISKTISQIELFCDISKWDTVGDVDICPPYYPCCFHFRGNSSIYQEITDINYLQNIGRSWEILYFYTENIPSNDNGNLLVYHDSYNCSDALGSNNYRYTITSSSNKDNWEYESTVSNCDYIMPQINLTVNFVDIEIYYMNGYFCNNDCPSPTPAPTIQSEIYDNTDNIYEDMCSNVVKDPDWMDSGNPDGINDAFGSILCPTITTKQCCTLLEAENIWIVKSYNLTLYSNIHVRYSLKNDNFDDQGDRTQLLYNCGIGDWIELAITTSDETIVQERSLVPECDYSNNVSIAFWTHFTKHDNLTKWARIGDYEICNGPCTTTSTTNQPSNDDSKKNNAGVVVAVILILLLIICVIGYLYYRRNRTKLAVKGMTNMLSKYGTANE